MSAKLVKPLISTWNCVGKFGYGQGRAAAELGDQLTTERLVCGDICPKSAECRDQHRTSMDARFPRCAAIVEQTIDAARSNGLPVMPLVVSAMRVASRRREPEASQLREGLRQFGINDMTDHYIYGQLENLNNGLNTRDPQSLPIQVALPLELWTRTLI